MSSGLSSGKPGSCLVRVEREGICSVVNTPLRDPFLSKADCPVVTCLLGRTAVCWGESLDKGSLTKILEDQPEAENRDYDFSPNALRNSSAGIWGRMDS